MLPPCANTLAQKTKRTSMIASIWYNADTPEPAKDMDPSECGWQREGGAWTPHWYDGDMIPRSLAMNDEEGDKNDEASGDSNDEYSTASSNEDSEEGNGDDYEQSDDGSEWSEASIDD